MKRWFPSYQYLLKAHIDYLMMTGLLFIFFLLFTYFRLTPPPLIVVAMSVGYGGAAWVVARAVALGAFPAQIRACDGIGFLPSRIHVDRGFQRDERK